MTAGTTSDIFAADRRLPHSDSMPAGQPLSEMEAGLQPLDEVLTRLNLRSHDLVAASADHLTHKEVQKGRKGRRLTANLQGKIARALSAATGAAYSPQDLFNYEGR